MIINEEVFIKNVHKQTRVKNLVVEPLSKGPNTFRKRRKTLFMHFKLTQINMHSLNKCPLKILSNVLETINT